MPALVNSIPICEPCQVHLEALPYKYPMRNAVTYVAELRQIEICKSKGYPCIKLERLRDDWVSVVGFGPSLIETWPEITHPCITVGGAHDFLIERGVIPDWHAECDGRDHKPKHLEHPNKDVTYLMATICNPKMWEQLEGHKVVTWHNANGYHVVDWIGTFDPNAILVCGGSVVGLSAIHLCGILGFRKFKLFGFDGNFRGNARHAGPHFGQPQRPIARIAGDRTWITSPQMSNACDELMWLVRDNPELEFEVYGNCLLGDMVRAAGN